MNTSRGTRVPREPTGRSTAADTRLAAAACVRCYQRNQILTLFFPLLGTEAVGPRVSVSSWFNGMVINFVKYRCSGLDRGVPHFFGPGVKRSEWTEAINRTDRSEMESRADGCCCLQDFRLGSENTHILTMIDAQKLRGDARASQLCSFG